MTWRWLLENVKVSSRIASVVICPSVRLSVCLFDFKRHVLPTCLSTRTRTRFSFRSKNVEVFQKWMNERSLSLPGGLSVYRVWSGMPCGHLCLSQTAKVAGISICSVLEQPCVDCGSMQHQIFTPHACTWVVQVRREIHLVKKMFANNNNNNTEDNAVIWQPLLEFIRFTWWIQNRICTNVLCSFIY